MSASLIIVFVIGALFIGALLYLGSGKSIKDRPRKSERFGPLILVLMPLLSWMAYTQLNKSQASLFNVYPLLNYIALAVFICAYVWEKERKKG